MNEISSSERGAATADAAYPPSLQAWFACFALTLGSILAFMDRGVISLFIAPIQRDLGLNDTQISLLIGFAFGVFNALFGLPVARLVDAGSRKTIAAIGVLFWSAATSVCGLAGNFAQLFLARIGVGAGEAAVTPSAVSLFADYFPPHRRGLPMGIFYSGAFLGSGGVLVLGGLIWSAIGDRELNLPVIGQIHSWQAILIGLGAVGLIVAPLTLLIREPPRRTQAHETKHESVPIKDVIAWYGRNARAIFGHNIGFCLQNMSLHAAAAWLPAVLMRTQGWSLAQAGLVFGAILLVTGPGGSILAGALADALERRGHSDAKLRICILGAFGGAVASIVIALSPGQPLVVAALILCCLFNTFGLPLAPGALQDIMPNALRGQGTAIYVFWINIIAAGVAPTAVALLTDYVFHDPQKVGWSFGIVAATGSLVAVVVLAATLKPFREMRARANGANRNQKIKPSGAGA